MIRLMILGALCALAVARPELYKEKEDFQFSRSSSDDGTKSGFYGAQRGNMGGNYERAHNMDSLAQNQMSGLVRHVEGELGDGARTRTGSVYSAANSRGTYGSGHFDLSNLAGRNFQEGGSYGDSQSQLSQTSASAYNAAGYVNSRSQNSRHSGYQATGHSDLNLQSDNLQALDNTQRTSQYDYGRQTSHSAGYNAQSGFQQHAAYDTSNTNLHSGGYGSNIQTRLVSATPVRIIVRPGTRVAIPVAAQTYDITHGSALIDQNSLNSEAEVLSNDNQRTVYRPSNAKHYESSYNYRKEWEKHDTIPSAVVTPTSTDNPFPKNSELYEDSQTRTASDQYDARRVDSQRAHSSNIYSGYNANVKSTSGQSRFNYDTLHNGASSHTNANAYSLAGYGSNHQETSSDSSVNGDNIQSQYNAGKYHGAGTDFNSLTQAAHNTGFNTDLNSQVENLNGKPKSYQSAYSYHKSWERQGDPYVIKPASSGYYDGQSSQRLATGSTKNQGYLATGSHYQQSHQSEADCDDNGHIRVARSYNIDQYQDTQQQSQNLEDLGQQVEDLGQQTQTLWGNTEHEAGQQAQNTWDNLENLSQQSHNKWDEMQQTWDKFEDMEQKPQDINKQLSNLEQNNQNDLGQRAQDTETELKYNPQDQQAQDKWDFSYKSQGDQENVNIYDQDHEQSNKFNLQEIQPPLTDDDIFSKYSQPLQKQNNQMSVWDNFDFGSYQNVQQNKSKSVNANSNVNKINWSSLSQHTDINQQPHNAGRNLEKSLLVHHNVNDNSSAKPFWEQIAVNTQQSHNIPDNNEQSNAGFLNSDDGYFNPQYQLAKDVNSFQETYINNLNESKNWNIYSNSHRQEQTTNTDNNAHSNAFETVSSNIAPLSSLWNKLGNIEQQSKISTGTSSENKGNGNDFSQVYNKTQNSYENVRRMRTYHMESSSQEHLNGHIKPYNDLIRYINEKDSNQNKSNGIQTEKESSLDLGRGDIGPEDLSDLKSYKYPFDIPVDIETIQHSNQHSTDQIKQNENNVTNTQHYYQDFQLNENQDNFNDFKQEGNLQVQTSHQFGHHKQQEFIQHEHVEKENQHEDTEQQNLRVFGLHENVKQTNPQDFEKQYDVEQQSFQNSEHRNNLEQQNLQDFGLHENLEQQNFGLQDNLEQQNVQDFGKQGNLEHQKDFGQQLNLEQQDYGKHDTLEQQNLQDFGQQVNLEKQNLHEFGKQDNLQQPNFGKHDNLEQPNLQDFEQQVNLEQQNLQDFGKQDNIQQQNLQDFGQQQNLQDSRKQNNLEQQNLQVFGQEDNLEQQNFQDFGQQVNLEQHNLQDFGQQDNLEQQNLQVFGQEDNLEQQNLQNFGQQVNLEPQNLQDFRQVTQDLKKPTNLEQSPTLDQLNVQGFGQNENLEQDSEQNFKYPKKQEEQITLPTNNVLSQTHFLPPEEMEELIEVKKQNNDLESISAQSPSTEVSPIEVVTENTGFWKSIGNKFSRAKSKISSWF